MNKEDVQKLLQAYNELNKEKPDIYCLTFDEHIKDELQTWDRLKLETYPLEKQVDFMLRRESSRVLSLKIYEAFQKYDMELLNDVLFEIAHLSQISNILSPGTDHAYYSFNIMPELLAANMPERINLILPEENGMCKGSTPGVAIINLFMSIWYQNEEFKEVAIKDATKQLNKKLNALCKAYIEYLLAVLAHDSDKASKQLELICKGTKKSKEFGENNFTRGFSRLAHGMYNLLAYVYDGELMETVKMPSCDNFCEDLAIWQKEHNFQQGKINYNYPDKLEIMNKIMLCMPPKMHLIKIDNKNNNIDVNRFKEEVIKLII